MNMLSSSDCMEWARVTCSCPVIVADQEAGGTGEEKTSPVAHHDSAFHGNGNGNGRQHQAIHIDVSNRITSIGEGKLKVR